MEHVDSKDITALLVEWSSGNQGAINELVPLVYSELRQLAARALRHERPGHTLRPTALVHELYLKLIDQRRVVCKDRDHFFAFASQIIRRVLVSYARRHNSLKRGGGQTKVALGESIIPSPCPDVDLVALDDALQCLSKIDPQQAQIVEMRFFGGLSIESTARVLGISDSTVSHDWNLARAWLKRELTRKSHHGTWTLASD
jgi:RNA polymerase sigma factor (TIGR02999 family)